MHRFTRRNFLKLSVMGLLSSGFPSRLKAGLAPRGSRSTQGLIGRIATDEKIISIYQEPDYDSPVVRKTTYDELLYLYYQQEIPQDDGSRQLWYRVWGGYLPGVYVQQTRYRLNQPQDTVPECGALAEITVPYTDALTYSASQGWKFKYRLYYETNHWVTGLQAGPDGSQWYQLSSQLSRSLVYYVRRNHIRLIPDLEYLPTSIHVSPEKKHLRVSLEEQTLSAFEDDKLVYKTEISSGLGYKEVNLKDPNATATPRGTFFVTSKYPSKHMGGITTTGAPGSFVLPGVPWTTFFIYETGVAFHGTYWHNNFGSRMSHGCVNMRNSDAKWLFRWVNPAYDPPYKNSCDWYNTGHGTRIEIE